MKTIPLSRGLFALVDDEDYPAVSAHRWFATVHRNTTYAARNLPAPRRGQVFMHRQIMGFVPGDGRQVDHIDHDGLNNQRSNLRPATFTQQLANQRKKRARDGHPYSSPFKGVYFALEAQSNPWRAQIRYGGKLRYLGSFRTEVDAAHAYDDAAREAWGQYAALNFPEAAA